MAYDFRKITSLAINYFEKSDAPYEKILCGHSTYISVWGHKPECIMTEILHNAITDEVRIATFSQPPTTEQAFKEALEQGGLEVTLEVKDKPDDHEFPQPAHC